MTRLEELQATIHKALDLLDGIMALSEQMEAITSSGESYNQPEI